MPSIEISFNMLPKIKWLNEPQRDNFDQVGSAPHEPREGEEDVLPYRWVIDKK